ncbi:dynactin subunit 6 [Diabrotica virgifera virgifera]|uniref:Dynactin subunit 6 n=1 Tax=Diabrotica virgifera virgifera TaxID=50390 RepID=A0A6P7GV79_DIAVI|nr:dynactin subunit 6 [Diabrotica virgifera virgifera]
MARNSIKILPGALVCEDCKLRGDITIGSGTIIHPGATIIAEAGPIIIGDNCLIEEQVKIVHRIPFDQKDKENTTPVLIIGPFNVFEVDCSVESPKIGSNNVFESKCFVGNKVTVSNGCTIGAGCKITEEQVLKDNIIIYGNNCHLREGLDKPVLQTLQMETLAKMLPNYHHLKKPNTKV